MMTDQERIEKNQELLEEELKKLKELYKEEIEEKNKKIKNRTPSPTSIPTVLK